MDDDEANALFSKHSQNSYVSSVDASMALQKKAMIQVAKDLSAAGLDEEAVMRIIESLYDRRVSPMLDQWLEVTDNFGPDAISDPIIRRSSKALLLALCRRIIKGMQNV